MNITKEAADGKLTITLEGRLDTTTAPDLDAELNAMPEGTSELVLDFNQLDYISSAGLRVLLSAQKRMAGALRVVGVNETVNEVFEVTGFSDILTIERKDGEQ